MHRILLVLCVLSCFVGTRLAADPPGRDLPRVLPFSGAPQPAGVVLLGAPERTRASAADTLAYDNSNFIQAWFAGGSGFEYADDVHMVREGRLSSLDIGYFNNSATVVEVIVRIYGNTANNDSISDILAGPYVGSSLPPGPNSISLLPPDDPMLPQHLWISVTFNSPHAGLIFADPPAVGSSENIWLDVGGDNVISGIPGTTVNANWFLRVRVELPVAVEQTTWTRLKQLYASR